MKIIHLSHSDVIGGASIAAYRLHRALLKKGVKSNMWVNKLGSGDWTIKDPASKLEKLFNELKPRLINNFTNKILRIDNKVIHSLSLLPSAWVKRINDSDADIVNLHWIQNEMISIKDISKIDKPIVWTLHDMWAFCGSEHYTDDFRWRKGYNNNNRPINESGFDLNYWTWKRKQKYWKKPMKIITPSQWLSRCVGESNLMSSWSVTSIANPINIESFKPIDKKIARDQLNLPIAKNLILFAAPGGEKDPRKGFDLLLSALKRLKDSTQHNNLELVVIGQTRQKLVPNNFPIHYMGHLHDDISLSLVYNSVDAIIIPSRQDNLPNTGVEAQACGVPIVSFNVGGLSDIVEHKETGYLAKAFDTYDLANGISWVITNSIDMNLREKARKNSVLKFSEIKIAENYINIYNEILSKSGKVSN